MSGARHVRIPRSPEGAPLWSARLAYLGVLAIATLVPFQLDMDSAAVAERLSLAFEPLMSAKDAVDAARNVALFAGWGGLWMVTTRRAQLAIDIAHATASGVLLSLAVEGLQLFSAVRNTSVLDLMTNGGGALVGALTIFVLTTTIRSVHGRRSFVGMPAFVFAAAYAGAVFLESIFPYFRQNPLPGVYGGPFTRFSAALRAFDSGSLFTIPELDIVLFLPLGFLAVAALVELGLGYGAAAATTAAAGLALSILAEIGHAFLAQPIQLGAIITHAAAIGAGGWLAAANLPSLSRRLHGRDRPLLLLVIYSVLLCAWSWRPFFPEFDFSALAEQFSLNRWIPLAAHAPRVDLFSVSDVMASFLLYIPLGALLAVWPLQHHGLRRGFLPAIYLAAAIELGQILVADRFFDITDILVAAAGVAIGWTVVRQAGFKPYGELLASAPARTRQPAARGRRR